VVVRAGRCFGDGADAGSPESWSLGSERASHHDRHAEKTETLSLYGAGRSSPNSSALALLAYRLYGRCNAHAVVTLPSHHEHPSRSLSLSAGIVTTAATGLPPATRHAWRRCSGALGYRQQGAFVFRVPKRVPPARTRVSGLDSGIRCLRRTVFGESRRTLEFALQNDRRRVVAAAREWMAPQQGKWFAWVHLFDPNSADIRPPAPLRSVWRAPYDGEAAYVDAALGPLLDDVISHRKTPRRYRHVGPRRGARRAMARRPTAFWRTRHADKVPLVIAQVPQEPRVSGRFRPWPVLHVDLVPTVLDAMGVAVPGRPGWPVAARSPQWRDYRSRAASLVLRRAMSGVAQPWWAPLRGVAGRGAKS